MKKRNLITLALALLFLGVSGARGQEPPKQGPEYDVLKKLVGTWNISMKDGGNESLGTITYKSELNGVWIANDLSVDFGGFKYQGHGMNSYDDQKKKYLTVWFDNMVTLPTTSEGTYDKAKKTLTMTGEGRGMDGKMEKQKSVLEFVDDNTINFTMYSGDGKDPTFSSVYKRKK
ncbi:DUF1579 family protein [Telmatocola sphagniphila]|uniref:DUF1579 family protein n=1 Tax=Telmatocola sphagniphila TaxID=1123043 RepID=A0A8E6EUG7_9BACT|nr:DUF1579 family protein [Telmatocola sphagniphila]QVL31237.1 DUF1579 family protein [Telmatocola sphagniphila]